jgi:hypothetical protein
MEVVAAQATTQPAKPKTFVPPSKPVRIGQHRIGETVDEWLTAAHLDLEDICKREPAEITQRAGGMADLPSWPERLKELQASAPCHVLGDIRGTGNGKYSAIESDGRKFDWIFANGKAAQASVFYIDGKDDVSIDQQVKFLVEAFGPPQHTSVITSQNAYGAKIDSPVRSWTLTDGTSIIALEGFSFSSGRNMIVSFSSKAYADSVNNKPVGKNPYTQP